MPRPAPEGAGAGGRPPLSQADAPPAAPAVQSPRPGSGSQTTRSTWAPGSRRRCAEDSVWVTRQPVTTSSFCGSPGRRPRCAGARRSPLTHQTRRRERRARSSSPLRARSRRWQPARCSGPPPPAPRNRRPPPPPGSAHRRALRRRRAMARRHRGRRSASAGARSSAIRSSPTYVVPAGRDIELQQPAALVLLCGRTVDLEPTHGATAEAQRARPSPPAPRSTTWVVPRPSARATSASITSGSLRQYGRAAERDAHAAGNSAVEAALRLEVAAGRRRARALQSEPLCRDPAGVQSGMPVFVAHQRCGVRR